MVRTYDNAYFDDERGTQVPKSSVFNNKFKEDGAPGKNFNTDLKNYLDPAVRAQRQPQTIPTTQAKLASRYDVYVGGKTLAKIQQWRVEKLQRGYQIALPEAQPTVRVTLLFGVGRDLDNLGLRFYFEQANDRVLINVPGIEPDGGAARWNVGITGRTDDKADIDQDQIRALLDGAGFADVAYRVAVLAAYSTGYGGLNQSVNEGLLRLQDVETVVYYDCVYRQDGPAPAPDDPPAPITAAENVTDNDELDDPQAPQDKRKSAYNCRRALDRIAGANPNAQFVGYMSSTPGSPRYLPVNGKNRYCVDLPTTIDLRVPAARPALTVLVLMRVLAYAEIDGQVNHKEIPQAFLNLKAKSFPIRGTVASSAATLQTKTGFSPSTTLLDWAKSNQKEVDAAYANRYAAFALVSSRKLMYKSGWPDPSNPEGVLHAGLLPEFGWEYLL